MTSKEIETKFEEHVEILKLLENLIVTQETTFVMHNERLQHLRRLYVAITDLKELQLKEQEEEPVEKKAVVRKSRGQK